MNRLTTFRGFPTHPKFDHRSNAVPASLGAFLKRGIKTKTPVSHSFGRGYGIANVKPLGTSLLLFEDLQKREISSRKPVASPRSEEVTAKLAASSPSPSTTPVSSKPTKSIEDKKLAEVEEKEDLNDIIQDLVDLSEKEIKGILEEDAASVHVEKGKTWLENSGFSLGVSPDDKDFLALTKTTGNSTVTITFKKDYEIDEEGEADFEDGLDEEEETEEQAVKAGEASGDKGDWVRSGDELPEREDFPIKHNIEVDVKINDAQGKPKGAVHFFAFAGQDDRLYVNDVICETTPEVLVDAKTETQAPVPEAPAKEVAKKKDKEDEEEDEDDVNKSFISFDDLSDTMQDRIYDYLDQLGVDDSLAHFVKVTVAREKKEADIAFLNKFKEILKV